MFRIMGLGPWLESLLDDSPVKLNKAGTGDWLNTEDLNDYVPCMGDTPVEAIWSYTIRTMDCIRLNIRDCEQSKAYAILYPAMRLDPSAFGSPLAPFL